MSVYFNPGAGSSGTTTLWTGVITVLTVVHAETPHDNHCRLIMNIGSFKGNSNSPSHRC